MIDTHTHLYMLEETPGSGVSFAEGLAAIDRAITSGVSLMVMPNVSVASAAPLLRLHQAAPEGATAVAVGLHPEDIDADWRQKVKDVFARFEEEHPVAVGEIGVDLYHDATWKTAQMDAFGEQMELARQMNLPVIIHCREALDETLEVIRQFSGTGCPRLLFHSFTSDAEAAKRILESTEDSLFGINGVVTFKNAPSLREAVGIIPSERIVLETDAPYLAPVPKRGKQNESSYLGFILDKIADVKGLSRGEMEMLTDRAARGFFFPGAASST